SDVCSSDLHGEYDQIKRRHRDHFLMFAEEVRPKLWGPDMAVWFGCLETEHNNLRSALERCRSDGDIDQELRLALAMTRFWDTHGHLREGRERLESVLSRLTPEIPAKYRVEAHGIAGWMAGAQFDWAAARIHYSHALAL